MLNFKEINQSELSKVRKDILAHQNYRCAICQCDLSDEQSNNQHVDHQHLYKSDELGYQGNGLIRGVLCRDCNALEGKIWNNIHRFGKSDKSNPVESRKNWLINLIDYYNNPYYNVEPILHPKEKRVETLQKSTYNKAHKWYKTKDFAYKRNGELKPFPKYQGKMTSKLKDFIEMMKSEGVEI